MVNVSEAFHKAIADGNPQMALLVFSDAVFTNADIDVSRGIEFHDYFNMDEDISIGQTTANEISFSLFNDDRLLNTYAFGDFLATIGVLVNETTYQQVEGVKITTPQATWVGADVPPYVRRSGTAVSAQPSFPVKSMLYHDGKVYAFSAAGARVVYDDKTGANITSKEPAINDFMKNKAKGWAGRGFVFTGKRLNIFDSGIKSTYEFAPLGWFKAERPKAPDVIEIDMSCYDYMVKFDEDMPTDKKLGVTYPVTLSNLLKKLCDYVGITLKTTSFINSTAKITERPEEFDSATMRDVVRWIAEAGAGNARMNRDGQLVIDWIRTTDQTLTPNDYESFNPYWYRTKKITKLYNRATDGSYEKTRGSGDEAYLIQDNPILKGVT